MQQQKQKLEEYRSKVGQNQVAAQPHMLADQQGKIVKKRQMLNSISSQNEQKYMMYSTDAIQNYQQSKRKAEQMLSVDPPKKKRPRKNFTLEENEADEAEITDDATGNRQRLEDQEDDDDSLFDEDKIK